MMEDLQQAYAAYQQALYHLRDPKVVGSLQAHIDPSLTLMCDRSPSYGMVLGSCMIDTVL